ncbi:MAG: mechanosensitive ion channel family protein [Chloroflexi bacterium]|nr:mechanosensitive ion channel family protein [Chloroflexota bacterium]
MLDLLETPSVVVGVQIVLIVIAALAAFLLIRTAVGIAVHHLLERRAEEAGTDLLAAPELERRIQTIRRLVVRIAGAVIAIIAVLMSLQLFGIDIGPAIAGLGVVGIAVGFGAQTLVRDWLAGIFIVLENQYSQGDIVGIAGVEGKVEDFSLRRTTLRDLSGTVHTVPNGQITVASNMTRLFSRVNLDVGVAYDTDLDRASELINTVGDDMLADPEWGNRMLDAPRVVRVDDLGDSAVTLKVLGEVRAAEQWAVGGELRKRILATFSRNGIEIPFPHRVVVNRAGADATEATAATLED